MQRKGKGKVKSERIVVMGSPGISGTSQEATTKKRDAPSFAVLAFAIVANSGLKSTMRPASSAERLHLCVCGCVKGGGRKRLIRLNARRCRVRRGRCGRCNGATHRSVASTLLRRRTAVSFAFWLSSSVAAAAKRGGRGRVGMGVTRSEGAVARACREMAAQPRYELELSTSRSLAIASGAARVVALSTTAARPSSSFDAILLGKNENKYSSFELLPSPLRNASFALCGVAFWHRFLHSHHS